jgi:hypothetical protein
MVLLMIVAVFAFFTISTGMFMWAIGTGGR